MPEYGRDTRSVLDCQYYVSPLQAAMLQSRLLFFALNRRQQHPTIEAFVLQVGGSDAQLRILLSGLQDSLSQVSISCRLRGGRCCLSALPQQERRAALVRPFRHHAQEERMSAGKQEQCSDETYLPVIL